MDQEKKERFVRAKNVVVFEHLTVEKGFRALLADQIANPLDDALTDSVDAELGKLVQKKIEKYGAPSLRKHIKLVYLFLTEGMQGSATGHVLGGEQETRIKQAFARASLPRGFPALKVIGISELQPIFAQVEARMPDVKLADFLLKEDGTGGYDTPKIAAALAQLARRDYARQEMFIRVDDDVQPASKGIEKLKERYYRLTHDARNRHFCMSWHYEDTPLDTLVGEPDYPELFRHFVNTYSIRTTFLGDPSSTCRFDPSEGKLVPEEPEGAPCRLNIVHTKYFIALFKEGRWGSNLQDPISGAGLCFDPDSLLELPPWCNASELITWIDDFVRWQMMSVYFGTSFDKGQGMLTAAGYPGFRQDRNDPDKFTHKDVAGSTTGYLDRVVMGCILSFCVEPSRYRSRKKEGFATLLQEPSYLVAQRRWKGGVKAQLRANATEHVRKVLQDWHHFFCAEEGNSEPGYLKTAPKRPDGFVPAPGNTFFNTYTLRQLLAIEEGRFDLVDRVLHVLDRYLELKYRFWPQVTAAIAGHASRYVESQRRAACDSSALAGVPAGPVDWLFAELDHLGGPEEREPARTSTASIALIGRPEATDSPQWLMQWNDGWQVMNLIAGHREKRDPTDLACIMRELHEELFGDLPDDELNRMHAALADAEEYRVPHPKWQDSFIQSVTKSEEPQPPHDFPPYVEFSQSKRKWSRYKFKIYQVELTEEGLKRLFHPSPFNVAARARKPEGPNEWVSQEDIERGWTKMGRPISPTARRILAV